MPRATLTFRLPEEQVEHRNAVDAGRAFSLLHDVVELIRQHEKYGQALSMEDLRRSIYSEFPDLDER